ncbi:hypothetical protein NDU88_004180 [Pleurodeles waltl]|uniref:Uncharacterized protein n=1 Tax=Pleurodeles waltl TaxID=8319 RepID=A0AAV7RKK8_PLEWA|nr:hypothetical protein NDU88_004180 [Pleurodeles waltl]
MPDVSYFGAWNGRSSKGDEVTYTLPIYEGYALHHAVQRVDLAGQDLTNYLRKLLEKKGALQASAKREIVQQMKEKCCYVAINADVEPFSDVPYTLPDGQTIILGDERFRTAEVFFKPQLTGKHTYGVHESLVRSLLRSDVDLRKTFAENIVLSGAVRLTVLMEQKQYTILAPGVSWMSDMYMVYVAIKGSRGELTVTVVQCVSCSPYHSSTPAAFGPQSLTVPPCRLPQARGAIAAGRTSGQP